MSKELNYYGELTQTGLTVVAKVYDLNGTQVGTDVTCTESGSLAIYIGDMPSAILGEYGVRFFDGATLLGQGVIYWNGEQEISFDTYNKVDELHKIEGLDASNPMNVTPTSRTAGSIDLDISGDGETTTTVTRQ